MMMQFNALHECLSIYVHDGNMPSSLSYYNQITSCTLAYIPLQSIHNISYNLLPLRYMHNVSILLYTNYNKFTSNNNVIIIASTHIFMS